MKFTKYASPHSFVFKIITHIILLFYNYTSIYAVKLKQYYVTRIQKCIEFTEEIILRWWCAVKIFYSYQRCEEDEFLWILNERGSNSQSTVYRSNRQSAQANQYGSHGCRHSAFGRRPTAMVACHYTCWRGPPWPRLPAPDGPARSAKRCGFCCTAACDVSAADAADDDGCCLARRLPWGGPPATIGLRGIWPDEYGGGWPCSWQHHHHLDCVTHQVLSQCSKLVRTLL